MGSPALGFPEKWASIWGGVMGFGVLKNSNFRGELLVFRGKPLQFGVCREPQGLLGSRRQFWGF